MNYRGGTPPNSLLQTPSPTRTPTTSPDPVTALSRERLPEKTTTPPEVTQTKHHECQTSGNVDNPACLQGLPRSHGHYVIEGLFTLSKEKQG